MLQAGLKSYITGDASISSLIGTSSSRRDQTSGYFAVSAPENSDMPAIVASQISRSSNHTLDGPMALQPTRIQFSCLGIDYDDAKFLARALIKLMVGFNGLLPDGTRVDYCSLALEIDGFEEQAGVFNCPVDLEFLFADISSD